MLIMLTAAAVFFAVNSLAAPSYPSGVADIKSGEVKVVFENLPTEYIEVKELYSLQYYMEKYPKAKEIMGYYKGTLYYWTKDEKKVLFLGGLGGVWKLNAAIAPVDAVGTFTIKYNSSNPEVVKVDENTGFITAVGKGSATITAKANNDSSLVGTCTVTVNDHSFGKWTPSKMSSLNHQRVCSCGMLETQEHAYGAWTNDDSKGKHVHKCTACGNSEYAEHTESPWITDSEAGVGVEGKMHTECYDCGKVMKTDVEPAITDYEISVAGGKAVDSAGKKKHSLSVGSNRHSTRSLNAL